MATGIKGIDYLPTRVAEQLRWESAAYDYDKKFLNPLLVEKFNPLLDYIKNIRKKELIVADVGFGTGSLIVKLASNPRFKKIYGIDYSDKMIEFAKKKCKYFRNVDFLKIDMTDLTPLRKELQHEKYDKLDIIFSINSILPRDPYSTELMLCEIAETLKPGAQFVAVLPSFDTVEYLRSLEFDKFKAKREEYLRKYFKNLPFKEILSNLWAWVDTWNLFSRKRKMNKRKRLYADDGVNIQRFIHKNEIEPLFKKAGLRLVRPPEKLKYPWEMAESINYGYFPDKGKIWDWFVVAEKMPERVSR